MALAPPPTLDLEEAWAEAAALFSNRRGMRVRGNWLYGISERAFADRFARATRRPGAKRVSHLLGLLSEADLRVFHARSVINHEQAVAGTRFTLIANVSVPVGLILLLNALFPRQVEALLTGGDLGAFIALAALVIGPILLFFEAWYCYSGVQQARDLSHVATLAMARRGLAPTQMATDQNPGGVNA